MGKRKTKPDYLVPESCQHIPYLMRFLKKAYGTVSTSVHNHGNSRLYAKPKRLRIKNMQLEKIQKETIKKLHRRPLSKAYIGKDLVDI